MNDEFLRVRSSPSFGPRLTLLVTFMTVGGCVANVSGPSSDDDTSGDSGGNSGGVARGGDTGAITEPLPPSRVLGSPTAAGLRIVRRLTDYEYNNTISDLFGNAKLPQLTGSDEAQGEQGFAEPAVDVQVDKLLDVSLAIARAAIDADTTLTGAASADPMTAVTSMLQTFGTRAFRRPLTDVETAGLKAVYENARSNLGYDHKEATRLVVAALLQSSGFLYHWQRQPSGTKDDVTKLAGYELASRLSYFLWASMPDTELFAAAAKGELQTEAQVKAQVTRMITSQKVARAVRSFYAQWLELDRIRQASKDPVLFPSFDEGQKNAMADAALKYVEDSYLASQTKLGGLFGDNAGYVNDKLASVYGAGNTMGAELRKVTFDANERAGILTMPAVIAAQSNSAATTPPRAGNMLWSRVLCQTMPPPPPGATGAFKSDEALTTRQNFARLETTAGCNSCHQTLNPLGYAFEAYDPIGRFRTKDDKGRAVDSSGSIELGGQKVAFSGLPDLSRKLSNSSELQECITRQWFRFALSRRETDADLFSLTTSFSTLSKQQGDLKGLLASIATSPTFRYRAAEPGETAQ